MEIKSDGFSSEILINWLTVLCKKGKLRGGLSHSLAPLKQQIMIDIVCHWSRTHASRLIGVETPALLLPFLNCFTNVLVVLNFYAFPFFQFNSPFPQSE
jgi:hypothetical protein